MGWNAFWAFLLSKARPKKALVNPPPQIWKQMQTLKRARARFWACGHIRAWGTILHFFQFYNFQASLNHRANPCSCFFTNWSGHPVSPGFFSRETRTKPLFQRQRITFLMLSLHARHPSWCQMKTRWYATKTVNGKKNRKRKRKTGDRAWFCGLADAFILSFFLYFFNNFNDF
jgi:hypothetical protein